MTTYTQHSFAAGELDPGLLGRQDLEKWRTGLRSCVNFFPRRQGFLSKRTGTDRVAEVPVGISVDADSRVIPFNDSIGDLDGGWCMLFTSMAITPFSSSGQTHGNISSPYTGSEIPEIGYCQSGDILILTHRNHPPHRLTLSYTDLRAVRPSVSSLSSSSAASATVVTVYATFLNSWTSGEKESYLSGAASIHDTLNPSVTFTASIPAPGADAAKAVSVIYLYVKWGDEGWRRFEFSAPEGWSAATQSLSAASLVFSHSSASESVVSLPDATPYRILPVFTLSPIDFALPPDAPSIGSATGAGWISSSTSCVYASGTAAYKLGGLKTIYYKVSAVYADGTETLPSSAKSVTYQLPWPDTGTISLHWSFSGDSGIDHYNIYKRTSYVYGLIGQVPSGTLAFQDDYIIPDVTTSPLRDPGVFAAAGDYPGLVGIYQQRLLFASSENDPQKIWFSRIGDLFNFAKTESTDEDGPLEFSLPLTGQPRILHLVVQRDIHALCQGSEWRIYPSAGSALTYKTVKAEMQSTFGACAWLRPVLSGQAVIFAEATGRSVREYKYDYANDGWSGRDLSILSAHIFQDSRIMSWAYQQHPDSELWCVLSDGTLSALTYMPEQEVYAWSRHAITNMTCLAVCATTSIVSPSSGSRPSSTEVFILASRAVGSAVILRVRPEPFGSGRIEDQVRMDDVRTIASGDAVPVGSVAVDLATGSVISEGGTAAGYSLAGISIDACARTLSPELPSTGTVQFTRKSVVGVALRLRRAGECSVRPGGYGSAAPIDIGAAPVLSGDGGISFDANDASRALPAGDYDVVPDQREDTDGSVELDSSGPWPLDILSITSRLSIQPDDGDAG